MSTIALFTTIPISIRIPMQLTTDIGEHAITSESTTPIIARGRVNSIINGSRRLSNCAAITIYISSIPRSIAIRSDFIASIITSNCPPVLRLMPSGAG